VGWFVIACFFGFLGYRQWPFLMGFVGSRDDTLRKRVGGSVAILLAFYVVPMWTFWLIGDRSLSDVADILSDGRVARLLLGLALGTGLAFVLAKSETPPTRFALSIGIGVLFVALAAPHIDEWLRRVTGLKSPLIELQLAGSSTHRIAVTEGTAVLFNLQSLKYLISYDQMIAADEEYFRQFPEGLSDPKTITEQLETLRVAFHDVVRPVAECVQNTIDKNWLSTDGARQLMAPAVGNLEQIIFGEEAVSNDYKLDETMHHNFWDSVTHLREEVIRKVPLASKIPECDASVPTDADKLPSYGEYKHLPYLHAAAALLISFMGDSATALEVLHRAYEEKQDNKPVLEFRDYRFLFVMGKLAFFQGNPNDVSLYYDPLNEMWNLARPIHRTYLSCLPAG
jgi:hypothetical protein